MADDLATKVLTDYPQLAFLLNDPEVGPLLLQAVDPNSGFDAATFQMKLLNTNWWRTSSASRRQWETLYNTDQATATQQIEQWKATLDRIGQRNGVQFSNDDLQWWALQYLPQGITADDPRIQAEIARVYATRPDLRISGAGDIPAIGDQVKQVANQYFHQLAPADIAWWQQKIASGDATIQGFQAEMARQAAARFPTFADQIQGGVTPDQLFSQQRNAIARELEVDPSTINLMSDPRWSQVLGVPTKDGQSRPMTYAESIMLARQQPEWQKTQGANQMGATLTQSLLQTFGKVG